MSESVILGIDLGTTNSLAAWMTPVGPNVVRDEAGSALVPSVVAFSADGRVTIGQEARAHAVQNPLATVYSVKRLMGRGVDDLAADLDFLPYQIVLIPITTMIGMSRLTCSAPRASSAMTRSMKWNSFCARRSASSSVFVR